MRLQFIFLLCFCFFTASRDGALAQSVKPDPAVKPALEFERIIRVSVPERPFLYLSNEEIATARQRTQNEAWAGKVKDNYVRIAETWVKRDYDFVKKIIPPYGSIYTYGLGLDLDPVQRKKMKWRGWADPRHVQAPDGTVYPNNEHPDDGMGWLDPVSGEKYYFLALANGMTIKNLESVDLPALVNAYALTGNEKYAERALWIMDALATIYPRAYEGPIDYPHNEPGRPDGGRLDRPYYQAARALMNYAYFTEVLSTSKYAKQSSPSNGRYGMLQNIELNMLMNGADYCLRMAQAGKGASFELNNGNIDYNRAPLVVGALLGIPQWVDWALNGPLGFKNAISNTIDINGRYFETGTSYASHTRELLLSTARFLRRMRLPDYPQGYEAYDDSRFALFALNFFTDIQVAGRLPLFGDAGPDAAIITDGLVFDPGTLKAAHEFYRYSNKKEIRQDALKKAAQMLADMPDDYKHSAPDLFNMYGWEQLTNEARSLKINSATAAGSTLFFDYGTAILRSGGKKNERAALIRFGPTLNHGQADELGLAFYARGREFSFDPGYYNTHLRFGFTSSTVAHNLLVVNRRNQLRQPSGGGDLQTWTDGSVLRSVAINDPQAYGDQNIELYKRRIALIDLSADESFIVDNFWSRGGHSYDYSLHGIKQGQLEVLSSSAAVLKEKRNGSVLASDIDYSSEMDPNGRVNSFAGKPFYFAPPGEGFGFLSHPATYSLTGPVNLKWSATDSTNHRMYVSHFAPPGAQLITAYSPRPATTMHLTYALSSVKAAPLETVRFTSVILPTAGENKLADVQQMEAKQSSARIFALRITPAAEVQSDIREHFYMSSDQNGSASFDGGLTFSGEEGYLGLNNAGKVISASLTGAGKISRGNFRFTVSPLFAKPLEILRVESEPFRVLVNAPVAQTHKLAGSIVQLTKAALIRPFVLRVKSVEAAGEQSWLIMEASSNVHASGVVKSFDRSTHSVVTDAPFPHTRPYTYNYNEKTGNSGSGIEVRDYNGGYNGFWLVNTGGKQRAEIRDLTNKRSQIVVEGKFGDIFKPGDKFEIQLLAPGDVLEVPSWAEIKRDANGHWKIAGPATVEISE